MPSTDLYICKMKTDIAKRVARFMILNYLSHLKMRYIEIKFTTIEAIDFMMPKYLSLSKAKNSTITSMGIIGFMMVICHSICTRMHRVKCSISKKIETIAIHLHTCFHPSLHYQAQIHLSCTKVIIEIKTCTP